MKYTKEMDEQEIFFKLYAIKHSLLEMVDIIEAIYKNMAYKKKLDEEHIASWIKIHPSNIYECSHCKKNVMTDDIEAYDYCHGCGYKMTSWNRGDL